MIFECVPQQGDGEYLRNLGGHYRFERVTLNPSSAGWSTRRPRQYVVGHLKGLHVPVPRSRIRLQTFIDECFGRTASYTPTEYCQSDQREIQLELDWASTRAEVRERHAGGSDPYGDPPDSFAAALTLTERARLAFFWIPGRGRTLT